MNSEDQCRVDKIDRNRTYKQLPLHCISRWLILGRDFEEADYLKDGSLRAPDCDGRRNQEMHNASHATWILSMVLSDIVDLRAERNTAKRTNRVLAHLSCLREFILDEHLRFYALINKLIKSLKKDFPDDDLTWTEFVVKHWVMIRAFAAHYGNDEKCFPQERYGQICDLYFKRHYVRRWWWKRKISAFVRRARKYRQEFCHKKRKLAP